MFTDIRVAVPIIAPPGSKMPCKSSVPCLAKPSFFIIERSQWPRPEAAWVVRLAPGLHTGVYIMGRAPRIPLFILEHICDQSEFERMNCGFIVSSRTKLKFPMCARGIKPIEGYHESPPPPRQGIVRIFSKRPQC